MVLSELKLGLTTQLVDRKNVDVLLCIFLQFVQFLLEYENIRVVKVVYSSTIIDRSETENRNVDCS